MGVTCIPSGRSTCSARSGAKRKRNSPSSGMPALLDRKKNEWKIKCTSKSKSSTMSPMSCSSTPNMVAGPSSPSSRRLSTERTSSRKRRSMLARSPWTKEVWRSKSCAATRPRKGKPRHQFGTDGGQLLSSGMVRGLIVFF